MNDGSQLSIWRPKSMNCMILCWTWALWPSRSKGAWIALEGSSARPSIQLYHKTPKRLSKGPSRPNKPRS